MRSTVIGAFLAAMLGSVAGVVLVVHRRTLGLAGGLRRGRFPG
jgi:hypothetical protein